MIFARLYIGWIVLICAEGLSGASLGSGFWNPWTLLVTFWLYFGHFFLFTTLAIHSGRCSLSALYLWGVLFGLYESWITKVVWYGYEGNGQSVPGWIGPFAYSEISMVFFFHPAISFILPLCILCMVSPAHRAQFPDLAWFSAPEKRPRLLRYFFIVSFAAVMAMNSGGPVNLLLNAAFALIILVALRRLAGESLHVASVTHATPAPAPLGTSLQALNAALLAEGPGANPVSVLAFGRRGFAALCVYLAALYVIGYVFIRPEGLPSIAVQLLTLALYAPPLYGLCRHGPIAPRTSALGFTGGTQEIRRLAGLLFVLALAFSFFAGQPLLAIFVLPSLLLWTPLGVALTGVALARCMRYGRA
ncbi:MAG: hypothetical protein HYV27_23845 [Candidatus Hydrogenedentes bacterium]|nr:hypothetical protein [Candidatus Hydrogenedentota bacterium]